MSNPTTMHELVPSPRDVTETIAQWADHLDNISHSMRLPMPADVHLSVLHEIIGNLRDDMRLLLKEQEEHYLELERVFMGDPDKQTGVYAPKGQAE